MKIFKGSDKISLIFVKCISRDDSFIKLSQKVKIINKNPIIPSQTP